MSNVVKKTTLFNNDKYSIILTTTKESIEEGGNCGYMRDGEYISAWEPITYHTEYHSECLVQYHDGKVIYDLDLMSSDEYYNHVQSPEIHDFNIKRYYKAELLKFKWIAYFDTAIKWYKFNFDKIKEEYLKWKSERIDENLDFAVVETDFQDYYRFTPIFDVYENYFLKDKEVPCFDDYYEIIVNDWDFEDGEAQEEWWRNNKAVSYIINC